MVYLHDIVMKKNINLVYEYFHEKFFTQMTYHERSCREFKEVREGLMF